MKTKLDNFSAAVLEDINKIRVNPSSAIKRFQNLKIITSCMKGTKNFVKEINELLEIITDAPGINALNLSPGLCLAAQMQIEKYEEDQFFSNYVLDEELRARCSDYTTGWKKVYQLADDGGDEHEDVINRLINMVKDEEKICRRILLDNSLKHIGLAYKLINKRNTVVIIVTEDVQEVELKPTVEGFFDYLNSIRVSPIDHIATFDLLSETLKKKNKQSAEAKNVSNFLTKIKNEPLRALNHSDILRDLAQLVMENLSTIKNSDNLKDLASKNYSGFNDLAFFVNNKEKRGEKIVTELLLDGEARSKFLENANMKLIGVLYIPKSGDNEASTVVVIADNIEEGINDEKFDQKFINQINRMRKEPTIAIPYLVDISAKTKKLFQSSKKEFIKEIDNLIVEFAQYKNELPEIKLSPELCDAANEYIDHLLESSVKKYYPQDEEYLKISLSHYIQGFTLAKEFIQVGGIRTEAVITDLLVSENDKERESRKALLNKNILFAGIAHETIRGEPVTIVILTDKADELAISKFSDSLLQQMNNIRLHPKSFVKYIQAIIDQANYPSRSMTKSQKESYMQEMAILKKFLQTTRAYGPLILDQNLSEAAFAKLDEIRSSNQKRIKKFNEEELRNLLSEFGSRFTSVHEFYDVGTEDPKQVLINMLTNDIEKRNRDAIFSLRINVVGIARSSEISQNDDQEVAADDNSTVILFTDNFEAPIEHELINPTYDKKNIIKRPNLTHDEIQQIKKDFKMLDVLNTGYIKPNIILIFMQNSWDFSEKNPFYYDAIRLLNTDENNDNGVDVDEFINGVAKTINTYHQEQRWYELFSIYTNKDKKKIIDFDTLKRVTDEIGYVISNDDLLSILEKLSEKNAIDKDKFIETMNLAENNMRNAIK
jgi:Ca2+-binding EF-hand superfamily protein/uncharacterized protein YkwD